MKWSLQLAGSTEIVIEGFRAFYSFFEEGIAKAIRLY